MRNRDSGAGKARFWGGRGFRRCWEYWREEVLLKKSQFGLRQGWVRREG